MNHFPIFRSRSPRPHPLLRCWAWTVCVFILASCAPPSSPPSTASPSIPSSSLSTSAVMPCTVLPSAPDSSVSMTAFIDEFAHVLGPAQAPVTLFLFTDFQCDGCALLSSALAQVLAAHPEEVRLVLRYLPDPRYDKSALAIQAAEAAHLQGKFWEMYDLLFTRQPDWYGLPPQDFPSWLSAQAGELGLDVGRFTADFSGEEVALHLQQALNAATSLGYLPPLLFIDSSTPYTGLADPASLDQMVRLALLEQVKFHACPPWEVDVSREYLVTFKTALGDVVIQLFPEKAPLAVNSFLFLARQDWYDGSPFHRVEAGFIAEGGDPSGTGYGNPGYYFTTESAPGVSFDRPGLLAMSNVGVDTNASQFFITLGPTPRLNGQFTILGEVLTGLDLVERLTPGDLLLDIIVVER